MSSSAGGLVQEQELERLRLNELLNVLQIFVGASTSVRHTNGHWLSMRCLLNYFCEHSEPAIFPDPFSMMFD